MADLFSEMPQPNLWSGLEDTTSQAPPVSAPTMGEDAVNRLAGLAAVQNVQGATDKSDFVQQYEDMSAQYKSMITTSGDMSTRIEAAAAQQKGQLDSLIKLAGDAPKIDPSGQLMKGAVQASAALVQEDLTQRAKFAVEQRGIESMQSMAASGDATQAQVLANNLLRSGPDDVQRQMATKRLMIASILDKANIDKENQGWFWDATDFLVGWVPFRHGLVSVGNVDIDNGLKHWYDGLVNPGGRVQNESSAFWNAPDLATAHDIASQVAQRAYDRSSFLGFHDKEDELNILAGINRAPNALLSNALTITDNVGWLPLGAITKAISIPGMLVRSGARAEAGEILAKTALEFGTDGVDIAAAKNGIKATEVADNMVPTAISVGGPTSKVSLTGEANTAFERGQQLADILPAIDTERWANPAEKSAAVQQAVKDVIEATGRDVKDVTVAENADTKLTGSGKVSSVDITMGRKDGNGYANAKSATKAAASLGYHDAEIITDESGQSFFKVTKNIPETGLYANLDNPPARGLISRFLIGARRLQSKFSADLAQQATNTKAATINALHQNYAKTFTQLAQNQRQDLAQIMKLGENTSKWFNDAELGTLYERAFKRAPTKKELTAYKAYQDLNDVEFALRNDHDIYMPKLIKGFEGAEIDSGIVKFKGNALIDRSLDKVPAEERVFNVSDNVHYHENNPLTPTRIQELKNQGYILVKAESGQLLHDGTTIKNFLVKGKDVKVSPLERVQLNYRAGGHRFYEGKWFTRQTVHGVQPDTGQKFLQNPNTYTVHLTQAEANFYTKSMESARLALKDGAGASTIDGLFDGHKGLPSGQKFIDDMEAGRYEKDTPFVTNYDRELPEEYLTARSDTNTPNFVGDPDENTFSGWLRTNGRMYYSAKGDQLHDWQGNLAPTLDPFDAINRALRNVSNISSFSDYKNSIIERWVNTYDKYLNIRDLPENASKLSIFTDAKFTRSTSPEIAKIQQQALAQREIINRNLSWRTDFDRAIEQKSIDFQNWIVGSDPNSLRHSLGIKAVNWWQNKDPIQKIRGFAFDAKLGWFNPIQLPLQMQTMAAATMLSPKMGFHGMMMLPWMRMFISRSSDEAFLKEVADRGIHKLGGFETAEEMKDFMRSFKNSGFKDFGHNHQMASDYGINAVVGEFGDKFNAIKSGGRFFFNEGELYNRMVAWRIAWDETSKMGLSGAHFDRALAGRAEEYAFNMSKASSAWWQHGIMSIPTQFWAYNARMMEAMFGKTFTGAQKARLIVGQGLLYGTAGVPFLSFVSDRIKAHTGHEPDLNSLGGFFDRGLFDEAVYHATGQDVLIGQRAGTGNWIPQMIEDTLGMSQFGEKSPADILGGATASVFGQTMVDLSKFAYYATAESGDQTRPLTRDALLKLASNISLLGNLQKAYMVSRYGMLISSRGTVLANDMPSSSAFAIALGLQPGIQADLSAMMLKSKERQKGIDDAAKVVRNLRQKMLNDPDGLEDYANQSNAFIQLQPREWRQDILRKAHNTTDKSLYDGAAKRIARDRLQEMATQDSEDNQ